MAYPDSVDEYRDIENLPGLDYNPQDKKTLFAEDIQELRNSIIAIQQTLGTYPLTKGHQLMNTVVDTLHPVGSIYITTNHDNPGDLFGYGTWERYGSGRTLVSYDAFDSQFDTIGETGGAKTHTLTVNEMPAHRHSIDFSAQVGGSGDRIPVGGVGGYVGTDQDAVRVAGGGQAHNNLQPYIVVYMWRRSA